MAWNPVEQIKRDQYFSSHNPQNQSQLSFLGVALYGIISHRSIYTYIYMYIDMPIYIVTEWDTAVELTIH